MCARGGEGRDVREKTGDVREKIGDVRLKVLDSSRGGGVGLMTCITVTTAGLCRIVFFHHLSCSGFRAGRFTFDARVLDSLYMQLTFKTSRSSLPQLSCSHITCQKKREKAASSLRPDPSLFPYSPLVSPPSPRFPKPLVPLQGAFH